MRYKVKVGKVEWEIEIERGDKFKDRHGRWYMVDSLNPWQVCLLYDNFKEPIEMGIDKFCKYFLKEWGSGIGKKVGLRVYYKNLG